MARPLSNLLHFFVRISSWPEQSAVRCMERSCYLNTLQQHILSVAPFFLFFFAYWYVLYFLIVHHQSINRSILTCRVERTAYSISNIGSLRNSTFLSTQTNRPGQI